jgi:hypothetical protein
MVRHSQKIWGIFPILWVALLFAFSAGPLRAEVYKCENAKSQVIYSDTPCHSGSTQTITDIQANLALNQSNSQSAVMRQPDNAVKSAIAEENFVRADALAVTREQRDWIVLAKKDAARSMAAGRTEADVLAEQSNSDECRQAKVSLEKEASSSFRKSDVLAAKTSLMYVSCGLKDEPPAYASSNYAGQYAPFLYYPYPYYSRKRPGQFPHGARPAYPVAYTPYVHQRSIARYPDRDGFGLSIRVGSK